MTIEQTVEIPASRRLTLDVPREIPAGRTIITFTPAPVVSVKSGSADNTEKPTPISDRLLGLASGAGDNEKPATPLTDRLCGLLSHAGNISLEEIRTERLSKYLK